MQGPRIQSVLVGSLLWLGICIGGSYGLLVRLGEYGSIVQLLIGAAMALLGAVSHALLSFSVRFRRLAFWRRGLLNWAAAYVPFLALAGIFTNFRMIEHDPNFWASLARLLILYTGMPLLFVALLVAGVTSTRGTGSEA